MKDEGLKMMKDILDWLYAIKREMDKNGITFDEFIDDYEKVIKDLENRSRATEPLQECSGSIFIFRRQ